MKAKELKEKYLKFFESRRHKVIPSTSLIPSTEVEIAGTQKVLFSTAGMHPLIPYLLGQEHVAGKRLSNVQKCFRTDDIDEIGDAWHLTFFEMLGNWSLGDPASPNGIGQGGYWKKEAIPWSMEFLTRELGLEKEKIYVSVFGGDPEIPGVGADEESVSIWKDVGIPEERILRLGKPDNWWGPVGETGPCGPDTEMFYDTGKPAHGSDCKPGDNCGKYAEIWNDVFMEFNKTADGKYEPLKQKNVDTGMGVERTTAILQGKDNVYDTELFSPIINEIKNLAKDWDDRSGRILADHLRGSTFLISDGVTPSNVETGYILRRLIRRAIRYGKQLGINQKFASRIAEVTIDTDRDYYPELVQKKDIIKKELSLEEDRFETAIREGLKKSHRIFDLKVPISNEKYTKIMQAVGKREMFREMYRGEVESKDKDLSSEFGVKISQEEINKATISGKEAFDLYQTHGFPIEMIVELAQARNLLVDIEDFRKEVKNHQEVSRAGSEKKFAGGLADQSEVATKGHTATHLLHQALRTVLGEYVHQAGSNITPERIRFDFSHGEKLTDEEIKKVEELVNQKIKEDLPVKKEIMSPGEAKKAGAIGLFEEKYSDKVSVYSVGNFSKEICGGPHVEYTGQLGKSKIIKEEALGAGQRRIRA